MNATSRIFIAILGALVYAAGGAYIGSLNAGWLDYGREANPVLGVLGIGAGLVVAAFAGTAFSRRLRGVGGAGRAAQILLVLGPALYVVSWLIDFAIFGTLTLAAGLFCLTIAAVMHKLAAPVDRVLMGLSAIGSITWNTETTSAFLLVGVGLIWVVLSVRLLSGSDRRLVAPG